MNGTLNPKNSRQAGHADKDRSEFREICPQCMRPKQHCLCSEIQPFETRTEFVILIHPKEVKKIRNGTGRLAHLCLANSRLIMGKSFIQDPVVNGLLQDPENAVALLYPGESAVSAEEIHFPSDKNPVVFIMDGTWSGAQKMMRLSENLHGLPQIKINPENPSRFLIRKQPNPQCLSTIESIHALLNIWNRRGLEHLKDRHNNLIEVLDELVRTQLSYINDPNIEGRRRNPHVKTERPRSRSKR